MAIAGNGHCLDIGAFEILIAFVIDSEGDDIRWHSRDKVERPLVMDAVRKSWLLKHIKESSFIPFSVVSKISNPNAPLLIFKTCATLKRSPSHRQILKVTVFIYSRKSFQINNCDNLTSICSLQGDGVHPFEIIIVVVNPKDAWIQSTRS